MKRCQTVAFWNGGTGVWCTSWHEFNPIISKRVRHALITWTLMTPNDHE